MDIENATPEEITRLLTRCKGKRKGKSTWSFKRVQIDSLAHNILKTLGENRGGLTARELDADTSFEGTRTGAQLIRLLDLDLIYREPSGVYIITPEGLEALDHLEDIRQLYHM